MLKEKRPLLSDEYLDELANEINQLYGSTPKEKDEAPTKKDEENKS